MPSPNRGQRSRGMRRRSKTSGETRANGAAIIGILCVLAGLLFTWEAFRATPPSRTPTTAPASCSTTSSRVTSMQPADPSTLLDESTSRAHNSTDGPLWWLGARVPILGRNVDAVRTVAREIDQVVDQVLPGVVDVADKVRLETYRPKDGRIDLEAVAEAAPVMVKADKVLAQANRDVGAFDVDGLIGPLREPMTATPRSVQQHCRRRLCGRRRRQADAWHAGRRREEAFVPALIMNNAEVRSLAGMPGSVAVITAKGGKLEMGQQGGSQDIRPLRKPARSGSPRTSGRVPELHRHGPARHGHAPDFPRAAELAAAVVGKRWKEKYDGVVAIDPVGMAYMLGGLGAVDVGDGFTININNAVATLLNGDLCEVPNGHRQAGRSFEAAARRIFDATVAGTGDSVSGHPSARPRCDRATPDAVVTRRDRAEAHPDQWRLRRSGHRQRDAHSRRLRQRRRRRRRWSTTSA